MGAPAEVELRERIGGHPLWYHTLELAPGVLTPGWFDLRPIVGRLPWPDVRGKRCLDVGTYDGFLAFELERRGAREVIATDIGDERAWDWPPDMRGTGPTKLTELVSGERARGFEIAHDALGSSVRRLECSVYDLSPETVGRFDVVVCGSLLLHLRDPQRALEAIHGVCDQALLSAEEVRLGLSALHPRRPLAELNGSGELLQWWVPNSAGHRRMLFAAGFEVLRATRPYAVPFGVGHPGPNDLGARLRLWRRRLVLGHAGVPHAAALARPRL
ncbi:MAG: methyltransferase domain-containing protein [Actinobacteria bacterium]|nr:MAG: methyltransferase domain-containing protein [Actinomycetota bacterium]